MSRRRAATAAAVVEAQEEEEEEEEEVEEEAEEVGEAEEETSVTSLKFNESLTWRAGNKTPVNELLRRLKVLGKELKGLEQSDDVDRDPLTRYAKELVHPNLLQHKDKGIKAHTIHCLADVFRLCAPEAPFGAQQIKEIFSVIITSIIPALSDTADAYHAEHLYVLSSLAQVKSIVLLTDVPSPNQLILKLFETCFDILSSPGEEMSKNIEYHMTSIVECMIDETQSLPHEIIEIVLAQFMRADPKLANASSSKAKKGAQSAQDDPDFVPLAQYSAAYNMAKNVANTCVDKMSRYVSQYFSNVIITATTSSAERSRKTKGRNSRRDSSPVDDEDDLDGDVGPDTEGLRQLDKAHKLLRELWRAAPGVLQNVIPQIETELNAENVDIRIIATETIGDMASGIGAAGPPPPAVLDPAVYPSFTLGTAARDFGTLTGPSLPSAPQAFSQTHPATYQSFLSRQNDKSPLIRAALMTSIGRILSTSAGGIGLESQEEIDLIKVWAERLADTDERVRIAVIESIASMHFLDIVNKLGVSGGVGRPGSVLHNLSLLVKDRRHSVRAEASELLGRIWGVASGEITLGNERITALFGAVPSAIFCAIYVNEIDVNINIDRALYESLMPMGWPNIKKKNKNAPQSQDAVDSQNHTEPTNLEAQADKLRAERLLTMLKGLDDKAKKVFFSLMKAQKNTTDYFKAYLRRCEQYKGGAVEENAKEIKTHLGRLIEFFAKGFADPPRAAEDLWKFAKQGDKRNIALFRFSVADDSDYGKVYKSMKEIMRRTDTLSTTTGTLPQTLTTLSYKVANILYNRSHIHPIMEFSRSADDSLANPAHELTKEISSVRPGVFKAHIQELCNVLQEQAPRPGRPNEADALDSLKACASFAKRFPKEVSNDPKFIQAMTQFALRGTPAATAKYATSIIMSVPDKKELRMNDLLRQCTAGFTYGSEHFMARLATLSQLMLLAATSLDETADVDPVIDIAIEQVLLANRTSPSSADVDWDPQPDEECEAKTWALKLLVNRLRSYDSAEKAKEAAIPMYKLLNKLVVNEGELTSTSSTPRPHRSWLHMQAAIQLLKLSTTHNFDDYLTPKNFNTLALVAQASLLHVRQGFVNKVQKYLGQDRLPSRFYTTIFLLTFEPNRKLRQDATTWLKARAQLAASAKKTTFETTFFRLLSLLAHHPDFENSPDELKLSADYILFYLKAIATEANVPLVYHVAQKLRSVMDAIDADKSENLYVLSELAQTIIGHFADNHGWSMQAYAGKFRYPSGLFKPLPSSELSLEIAQKQYLPQELVDDLEGHVKDSMRQSKKRKSADAENGDGPNKKQRATASTVTTNAAAKTKSVSKKTGAKTPKKKRPAKAKEDSPPLTERRKSGRGAAVAKKSYVEVSDAEDDVEMEQWEDAADVEEDEDESESEKEEASDNEVEEVSVPRESITVKRTPVSKGRRPVAKASKKDESDDELSEPPDSD